MNVQQLFQAIGEIDERFVLEAETNVTPHRRAKIAAVAAAAAVVVAGSIWFSTAVLDRSPREPLPPDLAAPTETVAPDETAAPTVPPETAPPAPAPSEPVSIPPEQGSDQTPAPTEPTPKPADVPSGWGGSTLPSLPGSGGSGSGALPGLPLPGSGALPLNPFAGIAYQGRYIHSAAGDYILFYDSYYGTPVLTISITGQIVDGHYSGTVYGFPFGESRNVELQVHEDGSYDLTVNP